MTTGITTRLATTADAAAIAAIYNEGIADRRHVRDRAAQYGADQDPARRQG
jgi:hypothetical protein